jgi:stress response protein SCP2
MAINLVKGQRVGLDAGLTRLKVEMGWKVNPNAEPPYDLDASTFLLGDSGQIDNEFNFVFYGSPNQVEVKDGISWTKVEYGGQEGWVATDKIKINGDNL